MLMGGGAINVHPIKGVTQNVLPCFEGRVPQILHNCRTLKPFTECFMVIWLTIGFVPLPFYVYILGKLLYVYDLRI